jgi:hypothetical protein
MGCSNGKMPKKKLGTIYLYNTGKLIKYTDYRYINKFIYQSRFIVYDTVQLVKDIDFVNVRLSKEVTWGKLIFDTLNHEFVFLTTEMEISVILIKVKNNSNHFIGKEDILPTLSTRPWIEEIYSQILLEYSKRIEDIFRDELPLALIKLIVQHLY